MNVEPTSMAYLYAFFVLLYFGCLVALWVQVAQPFVTAGDVHGVVAASRTALALFGTSVGSAFALVLLALKSIWVSNDPGHFAAFMLGRGPLWSLTPFEGLPVGFVGDVVVAIPPLVGGVLMIAAVHRRLEGRFLWMGWLGVAVGVVYVLGTFGV
jgi:hypothetical protein